MSGQWLRKGLQRWSSESLDSDLLYIASSIEIDINSIHQFIQLI